jgi:hypothetical protein
MSREKPLDVCFTRELDVMAGLMDVEAVVSVRNAINGRNTNAVGRSSSMRINHLNKSFGSGRGSGTNGKIINLATYQNELATEHTSIQITFVPGGGETQSRTG